MRTLSLHPSRRLWRITVLLAAAACHGSDLTGPTTQGPQVSAAMTASLSLTGRIAFVSTRDGNAEIYVMKADGTGLSRLTNNGVSDAEPAWSPGGTKIAFVRGSGLGEEIYVMNADGTGVKRLTNNGYFDEMPAWSPDGATIAFVSTADTYRHVYVMNANGTGVTRLTQGTTADFFPTWSHDGTRIAFQHLSHRIVNRQIVFSWDIAVVPSGGGGILTIPNTGRGFHPAWSPDGTRIVFSSDRDGLFHNNTPARELYRVNPDGSGLTRLTNNTVNDDWPTWSPGSNKVAFQSDRSGTLEIYLMNPTGSGVARFTSTSVNSEPAWGP
jgi:Tol biopolymer transport system component